jgi:sRNA-binding carbon storage regulator CsrA
MITIILKEDEPLHIGDNIVISCYRHQDRILQRCGVPSSSPQVKFAIDAPQEVKVLRSELYELTD